MQCKKKINQWYIKIKMNCFYEKKSSVIVQYYYDLVI